MNGSERIGWNQPASDLSTLQGYQYVAYVDDTRVALTGSRCDVTPSGAGYECSAPLPRLTPGAHEVALATWVSVNGAVVESVRSAPLQLVMIGQSAADVVGLETGDVTSPRDSRASSPNSAEFTTTDGVHLRAEILTTGLDALTGMAVAPDGRVFVLEESGGVRVIAGGHVLPEPAVDLASGPLRARPCAITLHPGFERNGILFIADSIQSPEGETWLRIVRYRELQNAFGQSSVIVDSLPMPRSANCDGVRIRVGPDGKLYVTVPDDEAATVAHSLGALGGKVLRLNPDGTAPSDGPFHSPVFSLGHRLAGGIDWHPASRELWLAEQGSEDEDELNVILPGRDYGWPPGPRGDARPRTETPRFVVHPSVGIGAIAFHSGAGIPEFRNDLFVAALQGQQVLRLNLDPAGPPRTVRTERLWHGRFGRIAEITAESDGSLYLGTANRAQDHDVPHENYVVRIARVLGR